jgi:crotonobetainyl-CoA:carnitine CoA-transferase CaiB-like acyl-CoA transferase
MASTASKQDGRGPLQGLRVLDVTSMIAGPYAAAILADYGADVVKIEPPEGDLMRQGGGADGSADMGPIYLQANRNKRSVVLDLKQTAACTALLRLCERADVFLTNTRPAAMRRLGLAARDIRKVNPRLVHVSLTGYGQNGPYAGRPAYDDLIQGISAIAATLARVGGGEPRYVPLAVADRIVGLNAAHAILAALFQRARTGEGQSIELPMFETMTQFVLGDHLGGRSFDPPKGQTGYYRLLLATRRPYRTSDGHVCALVYTDKHWKAFFQGLERLDAYETNPHLAKFASRLKHPEEVYRLIANALASRTTAEALALFERCDIPCARLNDLDSLIDDPHLAAVDFFQTMTHPTEGPIRYTGIPSRWNGNALKITRHAPRLGEHSVAILEEAGLGKAEIDTLLSSGATVDGALVGKAAAAS